MVPFLEHLVLFGADLRIVELEKICRMDFDIFFLLLVFEPKSGFCMGYSFCMMADFQNGPISGIFRVFWSGVLHRTTGFSKWWHVSNI